MSGDTNAVEHIDAADAFARTLYVRAKQSPYPAFAEVAEVVRQLHLALRHLRVEAADPDSLLNSPDASVYARQLRPIVEDCDFTLKQLETVIEKYGSCPSYTSDGMADRVAAVRTKLANEKTNVDMFLDTVQLHNPANRPGGVVQGSEASLEGIKDKVDMIANRLFSRRQSGLPNGLNSDDDDLWQEFKSQLEMEGFAPQVLRKHKDVLRAYIRELESMSNLNGGAPPTVRGLLEHQQARSMLPPPVPPKELISPTIENEKCFPSMKAERRMPDHAPVLPPRRHQPNLSFERQSSSSDDSGIVTNDSLALISTKDLIAMDGLNTGMAGMHLQPYNGQNYSVSPTRNQQKFLTAEMTGALPAPPDADLSGSPNSQLLGASPRYVHPLPAYTSPNGQPAPYGSSPRLAPRLAPDRYGQDIPLDAPWTRIKRSLVSPEILEQAGVRYEARPEFVAILGHLTRDEIAEYARRSADCRAARSGQPPSRRHDQYQRTRADSKSSHEGDDDSVLWDESDTTDYDDDKTSQKGTRSYPYIVSPPDKKSKVSPSSTAMPKPILKNKNENHVRFDPEPYEVENKTLRSSNERERDRDRDRHGGHSSRRPRDNRESSTRHREGNRRDGDHHRTSHRDRDRDRRTDRKDERAMKKKAWGETLGAVGIGGAAVSLLSVLAEAASAV